MSNELITLGGGTTDVPAHIQARAAAARARNALAIGGIKAGGFPRLSLRGGKFHIVEGGVEKLITDPSGRLPLMELEVVVLGSNPAVSKVYYVGDYQSGSSDEPDCSSDDGIRPDPHVKAPQHSACATCPQNQWGSKISKTTGKEVKACSDVKRLVVVPAQDLKFKALSLQLPPASLKEWASFVKRLDEHGIDVNAVTIKITFDPSVEYPRLNFAPGRYLSEAECAIVDERGESAEVKDIIMPRRAAVPQLPPAVAAAAPAPAPAPAPTPAPADPFVGFEAFKPAVEAVGGLGSDAGRGLYKQLTGKDAPGVLEEEEAEAGDPLEGMSDEQKAIIAGAGGVGSPAGDAVLAAFKAQLQASAPKGEEKKPRGRKKKAEAEAAPAPVPAAPAAASEGTFSFGGAPAPAAAPTAAIPGGAAAPANVVSSGELGATLDALFGKK